MRKLLRVAAVLLFFVCIGTAKADSNQDLYYVLAGPGSATATFYLPVNPTVSLGNVDGTFGFTVTPIDLMVDGIADSSGDVTFYDISYGGGLTIDAGDLFDLINPSSSKIALFVSGTEAAPKMLDVSGDIPLMNFPTGPGGYTLTITPIPTPEPAASLLIGVGLISVMVKRRLSVSR
jgi:ABC-type glycerol-3-phosphate transport system substrate-binding protein